MANAEAPERKLCVSCGEEFGCGAKLDGCWCVGVILAAEIANSLKANYSDCFCPRCLHDASSTPAIIISYPDGTGEILNGDARVDTQNFREG